MDWVEQLPIRACMKERLHQLLRGPTLLERLGVVRSMRELLQSQFTATWFTTVLEHDTVFCTHVGTIPGSPIADILFQIIVTVALGTMLANLEQSGLRVQLLPVSESSCDSTSMPLPSWLDDVAILIEADNAGSVASDVAQAASIAFEGFQMIGVDLNFQPGKTEAIVHFAGRGAKAARQETMIEHYAVIPVRAGKQVVQLRCVHSYTRLGTLSSLERTHLNDVSSRRRVTEAVSGPLCKRVLSNPFLLPIEKTRLLQTVVLIRFAMEQECGSSRPKKLGRHSVLLT